MGFLNIVTGIIVENTVLASSINRKNQKLRSKVIPIMERALDKLDQNESGTCSIFEFEGTYRNKEIFDVFKQLRIDPRSIISLFHSFQSDTKGKVRHIDFIKEVLLWDRIANKEDFLVLRNYVENLNDRVEEYASLLKSADKKNIIQTKTILRISQPKSPMF
eukprot:TRINITY_DN2690_c0_g1_i1.p1 TRINITY_DN2690_c0_g1~~TRINITY_DN2690_c0_g1_i1.p1  ORF type:complete len:171 (-),score=11.62 TRINITY_DN2690_c0_g1_i1:71-556(-)